MTKTGPKPGDVGYHMLTRKQRILKRIVIDKNRCWVWTGPLDKKGYGRTFFGSRVDNTRVQLRIHRVAYEEWTGPIPPTMTIDHKCENKACCNPDHLQIATNAENSRLRGERMTHCRRGHERNVTNTYIAPSGRKQCRRCRSIVGS